MIATSVTLPDAAGAELGLLGRCLVNAGEAPAVLETVPLSAFGRDDVRAAMGIVEQLVADGKPVNTPAFISGFQARHKTMPSMELIGSPDSEHALYPVADLAKEVLTASRRRAGVLAADRAMRRFCDPGQDPDTVAGDLFDDLGTASAGSRDSLNGKEAVRLFIDDTERRYNLQGKPSGIATGLRQLDALTSGLQFGEMTVIGARPSIGKTALACDIIRHACLGAHVPTLIVTAEMSAAALVRRMWCSADSVPMQHIRSGELTQAEFAKLGAFNQKVAKAPIYFMQALNGTNISRIGACIRRHARQHGVKLVVVDYLQKIPASGRFEKRTYEVGSVSGALKDIAVQTGVAMLTLAQLNRESEKEKGRLPRMSDLADSGQIERDADLIGLLHRDRSNPAAGATLFVAKQRDGETGPVPLMFNGQFCRFENPGVIQ